MEYNYVSIHASAREATYFLALLEYPLIRFNPRLRTGGDKLPGCTGLAECTVSIHASAREATYETFKGTLEEAKFQSTPPHGRRPNVRLILGINIYVSIHASAREATSTSLSSSRWIWVSIHASAREATKSRLSAMLRARSFNPRLRTGGDLAGIQAMWRCPSFNPRLRTGGDLSNGIIILFAISFNPRLRTGGDGHSIKKQAFFKKFQSTPPHGRRLDQICRIPQFRSVSIHASAREATQALFLLDLLCCVSIHASAREATAIVAPVGADASVSIHASAREATHGFRSHSVFIKSFNPRLRTGGDPACP